MHAGLTDTKVSAIPSFNCSPGRFLMSSIVKNSHLFYRTPAIDVSYTTPAKLQGRCTRIPE